MFPLRGLFLIAGATALMMNQFAKAFTPKFISSQRRIIQSTSRLFATSATPGGPKVYAEGQDPGELFDLFEAPTAEEKNGGKVSKLRPMGKQKIRSKVHADGDWHRAAHIWLIDDHGGLLLQRRSKFKDTFPDRWDVSCAGHIEAGEEDFPTAIRELEEELGLVGPITTKLQKLFTLACTNKGATERHGAFTCNEYQEMFLLPVGEHKMSDYKFPEGEVSGLKVMHYKDLEAKLAAGDPEYVPRAPHYRTELWAYLDSIYSKK